MKGGGKVVSKRHSDTSDRHVRRARSFSERQEAQEIDICWCFHNKRAPMVTAVKGLNSWTLTLWEQLKSETNTPKTHHHQNEIHPEIGRIRFLPAQSLEEMHSVNL